MTREEKWTEWEVERKGDRLMEMRSGDLRDGGCWVVWFGKKRQ